MPLFYDNKLAEILYLIQPLIQFLPSGTEMISCLVSVGGVGNFRQSHTFQKLYIHFRIGL